jgi:predicted enzyme related to lactoylglutathione lyase
MSEHKMPAHGAFCWNELSTTDSDAAIKFYAELLGWEIKKSNAMEACEGSPDAPPMVYNEIVVEGQHVGGIYKMGPEFGGAPSHWMSYVAVDDVDARAAKAAELGGKLCVPPTDIPNVGRFCVVNDPTGAVIALITLKGAQS